MCSPWGTVASYKYNTWGKLLTATGTTASIHPIRYRGYCFDQETGLYYLQSRYYDPVVGRFINADAFAATGQGILGANMFAYCGNEPTLLRDGNGTLPHIACQVADSGDVSYKIWKYCEIVFNPEYFYSTWEGASFERRKEILQAYKNDMEEYLGVYIMEDIVFTYIEPSEGRINHGSYHEDNKTMYINEYIIREWSPKASYDSCFDTIRHEMRHAYQHGAVYRSNIYGMSYPYNERLDTIIAWENNFNNYIPSWQDFDQYSSQPVEVDARAFASGW